MGKEGVAGIKPNALSQAHSIYAELNGFLIFFLIFYFITTLFNKAE